MRGILLVLLAGGNLLASISPQQPTFRAGTTLVPVDVRVVDWHGRPITDLTPSDFRVYENGVRQTIAHFSTTRYGGPNGAVATTTVGETTGFSPQKHRIFLIVLGGGDLQGPSKGYDGLMGFVRTKLAPDDEVAVMGGGRATPFSTDHEATARLLAQFKSNTRPDFGPPSLIEASTPDATASRRTADHAPTLDDYMAAFQPTAQTVSRLLTAIRYLRHVDGGKHVIFVSRMGLNLANDDDFKAITNAANDARVAIDSIQTGGVSSGIAWTIADMERMSIATGGVVSMYSFADNATSRIADATSVEYLLGYYPSNPSTDDNYRKIKVEVNRGRVDVLYRHGYYAREPPPPPTPLDLRRYGRVADALGTFAFVKQLSVNASAVREAGGKTVLVHITVAPDGMSLPIVDGLHEGTLDVAVYCANIRDEIMGHLWHRVSLRLPDESYKRLLADGFQLDERVQIFDGTSFAKIVVYDVNSDRVGSIVVPTPKQKK